MSNSCAVIVGDIGGTNARLELIWYNRQESSTIPSITLVTRQTYRSSLFTGLSAILNRFIDEISNEKQAEENVLNALKDKL